jgi:hypothetical protein
MDNFYVRYERDPARTIHGGNPPNWVGVGHDYNLRSSGGNVPICISMKGKVRVLYKDGKEVVLKKKK